VASSQLDRKERDAEQEELLARIVAEAAEEIVANPRGPG
jgi:hypothetical protein